MRENRHKKQKKIVIISFAAASVLLTCYFILVNSLVSAALVPSFMENLEAFQRITDESYAAQVQTSDIKIELLTNLLIRKCHKIS